MKASGSKKPVERVFPFVLRSRILIVGRDNLRRSKRKLHFVLVTNDLSEGSREDIVREFRHYPIVQYFTSTDLEGFFRITGAKVVGFQKSDLARSIYAELKQYRINLPVHPSKGQQRRADSTAKPATTSAESSLPAGHPLPSSFFGPHHKGSFPSPVKSPRSRAFTQTELLVSIIVVALLMALLLPALHRAQERARASSCAGDLAEIGIAFKTWAVEMTNDYPMRVSASKGGTQESVGTGLAFPHFQVLSNEISTTRVFVCPADRQRTAAKDFASLSNTNISYFVGLDAQEETPQMILAGDRNVTNGTPLPPNRILALATNTKLGWTHEIHNCQGNVLLADSSVQRLSSSRLAEQVANSGGTNRLAIP